MAECEERSAESDEGATSFEQRVEDLFNRVANEEAVSSEPVGLVAALAYLDVQVSQEEVVEATREILEPTEVQFSKDGFLRFVELFRPQLPATEAESPCTTHVDSEGSHIVTSGVEVSCVEAGDRAPWVFVPKVSTASRR